MICLFSDRSSVRCVAHEQGCRQEAGSEGQSQGLRGALRVDAERIQSSVVVLSKMQWRLAAAKVSFSLHCTCCMVNIIIHVYLSLFFKLINNTNNIFFCLCNYIGINCICK